MLPNSEKTFILKTDASNTGVGAVLQQEDQRTGTLSPIQWASKKPTPTESRYGISEKEMLAIFWRIKRFEYELRGRNFRLVTDHKALEEIRRKPNFENNRINRWIEKIQEFDFTVKYSEGSKMVVADALSRVFEKRKETTKKNQEIAEKIKENQWRKHVTTEEGREGQENYWCFDSRIKVRISPESERRGIIVAAHEELERRGSETTYYKLKSEV